MPQYIPQKVLQRTVFPLGSGEDLATDIRLIEEAWAVSFPEVQYFMLDRLTTPVTTDNVADMGMLSGEAGASKFDPLWGEVADPTRTTWAQPQGTGGTVAATEQQVWLPQVPVRARVTLVQADTKLEKYSFDQDDRWIGSLLVLIPCSLMDKALLYAFAGDKLVWNDEEWFVNTPRRSGYWANTNIALYVNLMCEHRRHGS